MLHKLARTVGLLALPLIAACDLLMPPASLRPPEQRPAPPAATPAVQVPSATSEDSAALRAYYNRVLNDGLARGLLRTDGGGPDTPFTAAMLERNFEQIAFFNEYDRGPQPLRRWASPVRLNVRFGASVARSVQTRDANAVAQFAQRLSNITGHPISVGGGRPNFHVFFASEDDRPDVLRQIKSLVPEIDDSTMRTIAELPRTTYCLVVAFTPADRNGAYTQAVALIRTEQPDLMRLSCIHEELSQGLGLSNDSPQARPSIFNDDDEFALLTDHDEKLLQMLYDPRLKIGSSLTQARSIVRVLAREALGQDQ